MRKKQTTLSVTLLEQPMDALTLEWHRQFAPECETDDDGKRLAIYIQRFFPNGSNEEKLAAIRDELKFRYGA